MKLGDSNNLFELQICRKASCLPVREYIINLFINTERIFLVMFAIGYTHTASNLAFLSILDSI